MEPQTIGRWESKSGKHWVNLFSDGVAAWYQSSGGGGSFGNITAVNAIAAMQAKVNTGYFLPDNAKTPMTRTR